MAASNITVNGKIFTGSFLPESTSGVLAVVDLSVEQGEKLSIVPKIVFVVDVSGSMRSSMPNVKASLKAIFDCVVPIYVPDTDKETVFQSIVNAELITFSTDVKKVYPNPNNMSWLEVVDSLNTQTSTNLCDAMIMAINEFKDGECGYIVVLTDGLPNYGVYQTLTDFKTFAETIPQGVEVITLGYTINHDPYILSALGKFIYVDSPDTIPVILGGVVNEVLNSTYIKGVLTMDTGIDNKIVIGNGKIGSLYPGRQYTFGSLFTDISSDTISKNCTVKLSCVDIATGKTESSSYQFTCVDTSDDLFPEEYRLKYYDTRKGELLDILGAATDDNISFLIDTVEKEVLLWTEQGAIPHKQAVENIIKMLKSPDYRLRLKGKIISCGTSSSSSSQNNYSRPLDYTSSASSLSTIDRCTSSYKSHMTSYNVSI